MALYTEDFSAGPGGWSSWGYVEDESKVTKSGNPGTGPLAVPIVDGALRCSSPWWWVPLCRGLPPCALTLWCLRQGGLQPRAARPASLPGRAGRR